jgi:hypothetical protein
MVGDADGAVGVVAPVIMEVEGFDQEGEEQETDKEDRQALEHGRYVSAAGTIVKHYLERGTNMPAVCLGRRNFKNTVLPEGAKQTPHLLRPGQFTP